MVSYYVVYFMNVMINWGMVCVFGGLLFVVMFVLYVVYGCFMCINVSFGWVLGIGKWEGDVDYEIC